MNFDLKFALETFLLSLKGIPVTFEIVCIVLFFALIIGFFVAVGRENPRTIHAKLLELYVSFIRGTPFIVQTYLFYIAVPTVVQKILFEHHIDFNVNVIKGFWYAYVLLILYFSAIISEMFRAGLSAIDKGQLEAALTSGLSKFQAYRRIILPQVMVHCLPVLCTYVTGLVKMSSLAFAFGVFEITAIAKTNASRSLSYVESYTVIAILYIAINLSIERIFKILEKKFSGFKKS